METRIAVIGIIIESPGRLKSSTPFFMNIHPTSLAGWVFPYQKRNLSIISIVIDAPQNVISALSGKLGMLPDVSTKTVYSKI